MPELKAILSGLTEDTTPDIDADFDLCLDTSADELKKVKPRNKLALYALKASPTFTGTPAGPTAAPGTNTTQLATTAFVNAAAGGGGASLGKVYAMASGLALP